MKKELLQKISINKLQNLVTPPRRLHARITKTMLFNKFSTKLECSQRIPQRYDCKNEQKIPVSYSLNLIFGNVQYEEQDVTTFLRQVHQSILYSSMALGSPSAYTIKQKMLLLPQQQGKTTQKFLILDLDEVLLHIVQEGMPYEVELQGKDDKIRLNLRPFCQVFLNHMSQHYQIYIFTTALEEFANPIVEHFNSKSKIIQGILTHEHCLQTRSGLLIKDLRIIKNRDLSQIVILDSMVHSFGLQIENGIPIIAYRSNKYDRQLLGLQNLLLQLKNVPDVRQFLGRRLNLKNCCQVPEHQFIKASQRNVWRSKKRTTIF